MHALPKQGIEVNRQRRHQGFAFAGFHFGDVAFVQHHPTQQLDIKVTHVEQALSRFAHHGKCFGQQVIKRLALLEALSKHARFRP